MRTLAVALLASTISALAHAEPLYSKTFTMKAWCTGVDMVYSWRVNGGPPGPGVAQPPNEYNPAFIYPWRDEDITIRGVEVTEAAPARLIGYLLGAPYFGWMMVGNDAAEDIMLMVGAGQNRAANFFPGDSGFHFPGKKTMTPTSYIDLHGACRWPREAQMLVTIYYSLAHTN